MLTLQNPLWDGEPAISARDPAVIHHDGQYHCFFTAVSRQDGRIRMWVDVITSGDLRHWSAPRRLTEPAGFFSSPGNLLAAGEGFQLCVQSYPIPDGEEYGSDACRLFIMESPDLAGFSAPRVLSAEGCTARWACTRRQIDPYMVRREGQTYVFYKTDGCLGVMRSADGIHFEDASPDAPVLSPANTPDGATVENPCILQHEDHYLMFFAPCRKGRGIGIARSDDLLHWRDVRYLDFPCLPWAPGGPTAPMVIDDRARTGKWLMFFHGDREDAHGAALGIASSDDLLQWHVPSGGV